MSITAKVYDGSSPSTLIATLNSRRAPNWLHQLNDPGSGSVQIHVLDADLAAHPTITDHLNIVRFQIGGTDRFAFIVENPDLPPVPADENSGLWWTLSGRGVLAILEEAVVDAEYVGTSPDYRTFGWMAISYDDSGWGSAVEIQQQLDTAGTVTPHWIGYPQEFPDKYAWWIWSRAAAGSAPFMPVGTSYFRKTFTLADDTIVGIFATCDDTFRMFIDDEVIFDNRTSDVSAFGFHDTTRVDRTLAAGSHTFAVEATNLNWTPSSNYAGFIMTMIELNPGHGFTASSTRILHSDSSWLANDYPADPPGMYVGQILRELVEEAQARGALPGVTLGFTDTADSNSNTWAVVPDLGVPLPTSSVLDAAMMLKEQFIDLEMTPALVLNAYNRGTLGSDKTGTISLLRGTHFYELTGQSSGHLTNAMLMRTQQGQLVWREDATSLASYRRKETGIELGSAPSETQANRVADAVFPDFAYPVIQLSGKVTEASGPYTSFVPGDTIKMPNKANVATATTVTSIAVEEDEAANILFSVEGLQTDS